MSEEDFLKSRGWMPISLGWWVKVYPSGTEGRPKEGALARENYQREGRS